MVICVRLHLVCSLCFGAAQSWIQQGVSAKNGSNQSELLILTCLRSSVVFHNFTVSVK